MSGRSLQVKSCFHARDAARPRLYTVRENRVARVHRTKSPLTRPFRASSTQWSCNSRSGIVPETCQPSLTLTPAPAVKQRHSAQGIA